MDSRSVAIGPFLGDVAPSDVQRRYAPAILPGEDALPRARRGVITDGPIRVITMPISVITIDRSW